MFQSLEHLTGISEFKDDTYRWRRWWEQQRKLTDDEWLARVIENFARRNGRLDAERGSMESRLIAVQRKAFLALKKEEQDAALVTHLKDELLAVRLLGIKLAFERLVNRQPFSEDLKSAIRDLLEDDSPELRMRSAMR